MISPEDTAGTQLSFTFVLMAYNQEEYVGDAVKALLDQESEPVEILLSDDCSPDGTFDVMRDAVAGYEGPHRVILNRNARNLGVNRHIQRCYEMSSGDVIIATSGDDICYPNRAARTIEVFKRERPLLAFSQAKVETLNGEPAPASYQKATFYSRTDALSAATSMQLYLGATCAWHKDLFRKYGPIQFHDCFEDLVFGFRAALEGRVSFIDEELVIYRLGSGLTSSVTTAASPHEFQARRVSEVSREVSVLRQRLMDSSVFGLAATDTVMKSLNRRLQEREYRLEYIKGGAMGLFKLGWRHPFLSLGTVVSENRRWRKALKST